MKKEKNIAKESIYFTKKIYQRSLVKNFIEEIKKQIAEKICKGNVDNFKLPTVIYFLQFQFQNLKKRWNTAPKYIYFVSFSNLRISHKLLSRKKGL